ncbi:MAG: site-specific DNA-methyltransferase [Gemmatimonadetes bacterium]|nr:site-specific DNA-methyltransferase [Gemmatimonadota bacterium]
MTPYYADDWLTVWQGDCREVMASMAPESVHCVVTSPPYWGLRDYGTATWVGGDEACDHQRPVQPRNERPKGSFHGGTDDGDYAREPNYRDTCGRCGALRQDGQLGLEPTPEAYVENMVAVFREVRRVLRSDGTVWLNLGDSYWNHSPVRSASSDGWEKEWSGGLISEGPTQRRRANGHATLKMKDLVGIPWRTAFALQADGWYLRSDVIWSKPNPMPESVTDRPTKSHEYLFLLTKSPRYHFDADAVREPHTSGANTPEGLERRVAIGDPNRDRGSTKTSGDGKDRTKPPSRPPGYIGHVSGRNIRSVWTIATQPYPGAHFATFPRALVEPCIKAGTSEKGVCPECGAPWERVTERADALRESPAPRSVKIETTQGRSIRRGPGTTMSNSPTARVSATGTTTGWRSPCLCCADPRPDAPCIEHLPVPAIVLDPFAGSGTTGMVAQSLSRRAVLIDLNGEYLTQAMGRNRDIPLGLGA